MLMLGTFVSVVVAGAPTVSLQLLTVRPGVEPELASRVLSGLEARLSRAGFAPTIANPCATRASLCLASSAEGRAAAVGVDIGQLRQQFVIRVEAVDATGSALAEAFETTASAAELEHSLEGAAGLIGLLATQLLTRREVSPRLAEPPPPRPRFGAWVSAGGALGSAGGAITFLVFSLEARNVIERAQFIDPTGALYSHLPQSELTHLRSDVTGFALASVGLGVVSVALGVLTTMLFLPD